MEALWAYRSVLLQGVVVTLEIFAGSALLAVAAALIAGMARVSRFLPVRFISTIYVETFRGLSLLVELFILFFVLPEFGIVLPPYVTAVLGLGLCYGAYGSEIVRGTIKAIGQSQRDAVIALNLSQWRGFRYVVLPQALRQMLPLFGNLFIELLKSTSLVSLITLSDLSFAAASINRITMQTVPVFIFVLLAYFLLAQVIARSIRLCERTLFSWPL
jgi:polar amino acid transport system permease protein